LKSGEEKELNRNFLPGVKTGAVYAAGRGDTFVILSFAVFVLGSLPGGG
jgi:hypothetical protein